MKRGYLDFPDGQIHYRTEGHGEPLLLLHQAPLSSAEYLDIIPLLSPHYHVVAPDLPGHGMSDDLPREYEVEDYAQVMLQVMDALDIRQSYVVGHHSGAVIAKSLAMQYSSRVKKLVMSGAGIEKAEDIRQFLEVLKSRPMSRDLPMDPDGQFLIDSWGRYKAMMVHTKPSVIFNPFIIGQTARLRPYDAHYAIFRWQEKNPGLADVKCPMLVIYGTEEIFYRGELLDEVRSATPGCHTEIVEQSGAMVTFEKPADWASIVLNFLKN